MHKWKDEAKCLGMDTNLFFDKYEEDHFIARAIDKLCQACPVNKTCFSVGVSNKEWGVHGGVYLKEGSIDKEFNSHKSRQDWADVWESLTMEMQ
jgi:hypothetical protein